MNSKQKSDLVPILNLPNNERLLGLKELFYKEFRCEPSFIVRVPGRVNIIGEHIDYCGYPVLPMALEQDILIAAGLLQKRELHIRNSNEEHCQINMELKDFEDIKINNDSKGKPFWYNYVLCGIKGALEHLNNKFLYGMQFYIDGNIPPASGLSSSSALVSAACLSFLHAQNVKICKTEIASLCAKSERYIGTQGGGMDQAIAFLAEQNCAQYITFNPLKATPVTLPNNLAFVVAHSLAEANKAATNDFNRRVIECRFAAKILITLTGTNSEKKIITLSEVQYILGYSLNQMVELVLQHLPKDIYHKNEIIEILNITEEEMDNAYLTPNTRELKDFKLKQRALHVYEEAMRVEDFRTTCKQLISNGSSTTMTNGVNGSTVNENGEKKSNTIEDKLGELISASHDSLKKLYECSHDNLDHLVDISKKYGVHSRLTGAGWGGCIVALCPRDQVTDYIETLKLEYYEKYCGIKKDIANKYVFATKPDHGAIIYLL